MDIECKLKREGGTHVELGKIDYHFAPLADGAHVADVQDDEHVARFLSIPEGYRIYKGGEKPVAAPVETKAYVKNYPDGSVAVGDVQLPDLSPAQQDILLGSDSHPANFTIHGKTYQLGEIVARAHKASGLDVQEWNELEGPTREDLIDEVLDGLQADVNGDGKVDGKDERAALVEQHVAKFGVKPHHNVSVENLRKKLAE
ncbi:MAG: hypothetical protein K0S54_1126 [Alphaproteobacteria bacterium]|jgi:hypothetical protein|nr:hypothetical protein [Alphaproteobacteria bacterium]